MNESIIRNFTTEEIEINYGNFNLEQMTWALERLVRLGSEKNDEIDSLSTDVRSLEVELDDKEYELHVLSEQNDELEQEVKDLRASLKEKKDA